MESGMQENTKAVWNSMTEEQQMQVRKLQKEHGIKPATRLSNTEDRVTALEVKLGVSSLPKQVNA